MHFGYNHVTLGLVTHLGFMILIKVMLRACVMTFGGRWEDQMREQYPKAFTDRV